MRMMPQYERTPITVTFATTATTSVNVDLSGANLVGPCMLKALYLKTHTWAVAAAAASGASGGLVTIFDSDGNTVKAFAEVATASTTFMISGSNDIFLFPNYRIQYKISATKNEPRVVSGSDRTMADFTKPTVILYTA